jgi:DNA-binding response OmpR family regulator
MNLRRKIESDPSTPELLITRIGRGYEWTGGVSD